MLKVLTPPRRKQIHIGPNDDGRQMTLKEFDNAIGAEGHLYELNKGVVEVTNIPNLPHFFQMMAIRDMLSAYKIANPGIIRAIGRSHDTKVLIESEQSERHPDISVYISPAPQSGDVWSVWVPTIAFEVVSERSSKRDYEEKRVEYLEFGIQEYCIVDAFKKQMTVLTRFRGAWKDRVLKPSQAYTTRHLPGFKLDLKPVLVDAK